MDKIKKPIWQRTNQLLETDGTIYGELGDYQKEIECCEKTIQINPNNNTLGLT